MKINIFLPVITICCVTILMNACTKLKNSSYTDLIASEFKPDANDAGALLGSAYGSWRNVISPDDWGEGWWLAQETCNDQLVIPIRPFGFDDGGRHRRMHEHTWTVVDTYVSSQWWPAYQGISNCNRLIYQFESFGLEKEELDKIIAELRVLRASFYWVLCDNFGNVAFVDKFILPEGFIPPRKSRKEIYDFIVTEITESLPYLRDGRDGNTYGRFNNKGAANALLAKVYLNAEVYTGTSKWAECQAVCDSIIASDVYSLENVQKNVFVEKNENSPEIIFSVINDDVNTNSSLMLMFDYCLPQESKEIWNLAGGPWGGMGAIPQFISTFNPNDTRLINGFLHGQQYKYGTNIPINSYYGTKELFNIINYIPGIDSAQTFHGYYLNKYELQVGGGKTNTINNDFVVLRYADVLMMKAECLLRTGHADEAAEIVSAVRARNFTSDPSLATVTGAQLMEGSSYDYGLRNYKNSTTEGGADIQYGRMLDELGWEFVGEAHRRTDMIRFGIFHRKSFFSHSATMRSTEALFPIPEEELQKNTNLTQNAGY